MTHFCPIACVPDDVVYIMMAMLRLNDLGALAQVSKRMHRIATSNTFWLRKARASHLLHRPEMHSNVTDRVREVLSGLSQVARWCCPEAIGLCDADLAEMHGALSAAYPNRFTVKSIVFRGETLPFHYGRIQLKVSYGRWRFAFAEVPGWNRNSDPADVTIAYVTPQEEEEGTYPKWLLQSDFSRQPHAAFVCGAVLHCPPLPVTPSPDATSEFGYGKFLFRHAYIRHHGLCPFCGTRSIVEAYRRRSTTYFRSCNSCWLAPDLTFYITEQQALADFGIVKEELEFVACRAVNRRVQCNSRSRSSVKRPLVENDWVYRQADIAYLAILKWGSFAAVQRRKAAAASASTVVSSLSLAAPKSEDGWERDERGGKRLRIVSRDDEGGEYRGPTGGKRRATADAAPAQSTRPRSTRTTKKVFYGDEYENADTLLSDLLSWGCAGRVK